MKIRKQRIGLFVLFLLLGALGIWASNLPTAAAPTAQATPTPCATPATTSGRGRVVGGASSCTTTALPNKAGAKFGGGGDVLVPCRGFLAPEGSMVFGVYPADQFVLLGKPHASNDIAVQWCDWGSGDLFPFRLTDPTGRVIAEEAEGEYLIVACDVDNCDLGFSLLEVEPLGPPNGVSVPPLAWHEFYLPAVERQARVDPVSAWDGLRLRSGPGSNFARIGVLPANALVDVLNGPDSAGGVDWYEVHSIDSGDEGWVSGEYLIFTLSNPIVVPSERIRVSFRPGMTSSSFTASLSLDVPLAYAIRAQEGQELLIETDRRDVRVEVVDSSQIPLVVSEREEAYWRFSLPQNDDYTVILNGYQRTQVRIEVPAR